MIFPGLVLIRIGQFCYLRASKDQRRATSMTWRHGRWDITLFFTGLLVVTVGLTISATLVDDQARLARALALTLPPLAWMGLAMLVHAFWQSGRMRLAAMLVGLCMVGSSVEMALMLRYRDQGPVLLGWVFITVVPCLTVYGLLRMRWQLGKYERRLGLLTAAAWSFIFVLVAI